MMRIRTIVTALCVLLLLVALAGCQLAKSNANTTSNSDWLVGVFITNEHLDLFDIEGYLNDNLQGVSGGEIQIKGNSEKYNGRIYANLITKEETDPQTGEKRNREEYQFEGLEGYPFFTVEMPQENGESHSVTHRGEGLSNRHFGVHYSDTEEKLTQEGTMYLVPGATERAQYINPVYQSTDGRVYLTAGSGMFVEGVSSIGEVMSQKIEDSVVVTINGETKKKTTSCTISIETVLPPEKVTLLEMDENSKLLSKQHYTPGQIPESITPSIETAYIIMESKSTDFEGKSQTTRTLLSQEQGSLEALFATENGLCLKQEVALNWQGSK